MYRSKFSLELSLYFLFRKSSMTRSRVWPCALIFKEGGGVGGGVRDCAVTVGYGRLRAVKRDAQHGYGGGGYWLENVPRQTARVSAGSYRSVVKRVFSSLFYFFLSPQIFSMTRPTAISSVILSLFPMLWSYAPAAGRVVYQHGLLLRFEKTIILHQ